MSISTILSSTFNNSFKDLLRKSLSQFPESIITIISTMSTTFYLGTNDFFIEIDVKYLTISSVLQSNFEFLISRNFPHVINTWSLSCKREIVWEITQYIKHHEGISAPIVKSPLTSTVMREVCADSWDADFIDRIGKTKQNLYDLILAANFLNINCLMHLGLAKVASLIKGKPLDQLKAILSVDDSKITTSQQLLTSVEDDSMPLNPFPVNISGGSSLPEIYKDRTDPVISDDIDMVTLTNISEQLTGIESVDLFPENELFITYKLIHRACNQGNPHDRTKECFDLFKQRISACATTKDKAMFDLVSKRLIYVFSYLDRFPKGRPFLRDVVIKIADETDFINNEEGEATAEEEAEEEDQTTMSTIPSVTTSKQSVVVPLPLDDVWKLIRPGTFEWQTNLVAKTEKTGANRVISYKDKTQQTIQLTEISDRNYKLSWTMIISDPPVSYTSRDDTINLTSITALSQGINAQTLIEWDSNFSNDVTIEVIMDSNLKKQDAFADLIGNKVYQNGYSQKEKNIKHTELINGNNK